MNRRGEVPVIVLNPVYPSVYRELLKYGYNGRRPRSRRSRSSRSATASSSSTARTSASGAATTYDWSNATHVNRANMRRMLRYIVAHSDGALRLVARALHQLRLPVRLPAVRLVGWWGLPLAAAPARVPHGGVVRSSTPGGTGASCRSCSPRRRVDYIAGLAIVAHGRRARAAGSSWLAARSRRTSAMLGYFKYAGFFVDSLDGIGSALGLRHAAPGRSHIVLPIGISLLHVQLDVVHDRHLPPRGSQPARSLAALRRVRRAVPAPDRRADRALLDHRRPAAAADAAADVRSSPRSALFFLPAASSKKLLIADTLAPHVDRLFARHDAPRSWSTGWAAARRLLAAALLRLLRLLGHGGRARAPARLPLPAELQLALQGREHLRLLAPLAHVALALAARLPVHPARRLAAAAR